MVGTPKTTYRDVGQSSYEVSDSAKAKLAGLKVSRFSIFLRKAFYALLNPIGMAPSRSEAVEVENVSVYRDRLDPNNPRKTSVLVLPRVDACHSVSEDAPYGALVSAEKQLK